MQPSMVYLDITRYHLRFLELENYYTRRIPIISLGYLMALIDVISDRLWSTIGLWNVTFHPLTAHELQTQSNLFRHFTPLTKTSSEDSICQFIGDIIYILGSPKPTVP